MTTIEPSNLDDLYTQLDPTKRAALLRPLIDPLAADDATWHAHIWSAICWSYITEPGDLAAGNLIGTLGVAEALELAIHGTVTTIQEALWRQSVTMPEKSIEDAIKRWRPRFSVARITESIELARRHDVRVITDWDDQWPEGFDRLGAAAPIMLWVKGDLEILHRPAVAFVGARAATSYGESVAMDLASSSTSHVVVSGGAYGIDGAAHRAALAAGIPTVAYLAGGVERPYPAGHANLLARVAAGGALISEVPPGTAPTKWRFLQRNRLIAAHAEATIVVEAGWRSGSMNTAGHAQSLGRPLGAVPGPITSAASMGCHRLLRDFDATCITGWPDVKQLLEGVSA